MQGCRNWANHVGSHSKQPPDGLPYPGHSKKKQRLDHPWRCQNMEFESFGGMLEKAQKNIQTASNQLDEVMGKRTRAIQRKLKGVEALEGSESQTILSDVTSTDLLEKE
jgi:hypothetical protein